MNIPAGYTVCSACGAPYPASWNKTGKEGACQVGTLFFCSDKCKGKGVVGVDRPKSSRHLLRILALNECHQSGYIPGRD